MNTFFAALICYLTLALARKRDFSIALVGAFVSGLAICNQHTIILFEAPLILWILFLLRRYLFTRPIALVWLSLAFLAGLLPYLYIPLAANWYPAKLILVLLWILISDSQVSPVWQLGRSKRLAGVSASLPTAGLWNFPFVLRIKWYTE
jgi:hypothetical protein